MPRYPLSVIVVAFNMDRELPRTIQSLSPAIQRDIAADDYEIIIVDNGSDVPVDIDRCCRWGGNVRVHHVVDAAVSPAAAINAGLDLAQGELIGVMIDGARMASPGLLAAALRAAKFHDRCVIASLGFHLGFDMQYRSVRKGYDKNAEDALLEDIDWTKDAYRLFNISVFAGSSQQGWFRPISESNALFLSEPMWRELKGYDERFVSPGGGMINLDTYVRSCELPDSQLVVLLGEGTFHQIHGGVAASGWNSRMSREFNAEYNRVTGKPFAPPTARPWYFGALDPCVLRSIEMSARLADKPQFMAPVITWLSSPFRRRIRHRLRQTISLK